MVNRYGKMISTDRVYILMSVGLFSFYFGGLKLVPFLTNIDRTYNAIQDAIGEKLSFFYPFLSIPMAIQRGMRFVLWFAQKNNLQT